MVIQSAKLDPNAQSYTDDEIVGKVNAAAVAITRAAAIDGSALSAVDSDDIAEGAANFFAGISGADFIKASDTLEEITEGATKKHFTDTEQTKLGTIEDSATIDQTGAEVRDLIVALADVDRQLIITDPGSGQFKVVSVERDPDGKFNLKYDDVAEP